MPADITCFYDGRGERAGGSLSCVGSELEEG